VETIYNMVVDGHINYDFLISAFPWLVAEKQKAIISPDTDGILCGLLMSYYYDWQVVGYYDGKHLAIKQNLRPSDCVFLD